MTEQVAAEPDGAPRIAALDILRGIAILGILFMNINEMGGSVWASWTDPAHFGWTLSDRTAWAIRDVLAEGTARCLLEMLFGAGMMILTDRAATRLGEGAALRHYAVRNLVLLGFGLVHMFVLLWPGDILHSYAIAALVVMGFRRLSPAKLLAIGLWLTAAELVMAGMAAMMAPAASSPPVSRTQAIAVEDRMRRGDTAGWAAEQWRTGGTLLAKAEWDTLVEAASTMLVGAALLRWGILQGRRSRRFYVGLLVGGYGVGLPIRMAGVAAVLRGAPEPAVIDALYEVARLATTLGHVGLIALLIGTARGARWLAPFAAAGRTALTVYILQTLICLWLLYPPFGLALYGRQGWAAMMATAIGVNAVLLIGANWWIRRFTIAPVEWAWRSLAEGRLLPFGRVPQ